MTEPMTDARLAEIEARAAAATEGPWVTWDARDDEDDHLAFILMPEAMRSRPSWNEMGYISDEYPADAEFIANARQDVPALLAEVARLRECEFRLGQALVNMQLQEIDLRDQVDRLRAELDERDKWAAGA